MSDSDSSAADSDEQDSRHRRRETREERLYGVFAEDSDEERGVGGRKGGGRRGAVAFVASGAKSAMADSSEEEGNKAGGYVNSDDDADVGEDDEVGGEDEEEEEVAWRDTTTSVRGVGPSGTNVRTHLRELLSRVVKKEIVLEAGAPVAAAAAAVRPPSFTRGLGFSAVAESVGLSSSSSSSSSSSAPKLAAFEKHTKGFASKYLAKFNFEGKLGKESQGITKPIEVQVRPTKLGLGFGGFKEAATIKTNKEVEKELGRGTAAGGKEEALPPPAEGEAAPKKKAEGSRKAGGEGARQAPSRKKKRAVEYTTAASLLAATAVGDVSGSTFLSAAGSISRGGGTKVIDMRGPSTRVFSSLAEAGSGESSSGVDSAAAAAVEPLLCRELLRNLRALTDASQVELTVAARKLGAAKSMEVRLQREQAALAQEKAASQKEASLLEAVKGGSKTLADWLRRGCALVDERQRLEKIEEEAQKSIFSAASASASVPSPALGAARCLCTLLHEFSSRFRELVELASGGFGGGCGRGSYGEVDGGGADGVGGKSSARRQLHALLVFELFPPLFTLLLRRVKALWQPPVTACGQAAEVKELASLGGPFEGTITSTLLAGLRLCLFSLPESPEVELVRGAVQACLVPPLVQAISKASDDSGEEEKKVASSISSSSLRGDPRPLLELLTSLAPSSAFASPPSSALPSCVAAARSASLQTRALFPAAADLLSLPCYSSLLLHTLLPILVHYSTQWNPTSDSLPVQQWALPWGSHHLLGAWHASFTHSQQQQHSFADAGNSSSLQPIESCWGNLRAKMQDLLTQAWHPSDSSAITMLLPWRDAWGVGGAWESLVQRCILPKLASALLEACDFPEAEEAAITMPSLVVSWVTPWRAIMPPYLWSSLLEAQFWPAWFTVFSGRLGLLKTGGAPQLKAALKMYSLWRPVLLPPPASSAATALAGAGASPTPLGTLEDMQLHLRRALLLMDISVRLCEKVLPEPDALRQAGTVIEQVHSRARIYRLSGDAATLTSRESILRKGGRIVQGISLSSSSSSSSSSSASSASFVASSSNSIFASLTAGGGRGSGLAIGSSSVRGPSFRELVESSATAAGLSFIPHPKRAPVDGCTVFLLGKKHSVYINQGVLFVDSSSHGVYKPMSIDEAFIGAK